MQRSGMRKSTRRELRKLRELVRFLLAGRSCCFCGKAFVEGEAQYGTADGPVLKLKLALHHVNENRRDNREEENVKLACRCCHKAHHARQQAMAKRDEKRAAKRVSLTVV